MIGKGPAPLATAILLRSAFFFLVLAVPPHTALAELREVRQPFFGAECGPCAQRVEQRISEMAGVSRVIVDPIRQEMAVWLAPDNRVTPARLEEALKSNGFRPRPAAVRVEGILHRKGNAWFLQAGPLNRFRLRPSQGSEDWRSGPGAVAPGDRITVVGRMNAPASGEEWILTVKKIHRAEADGA